MKYLKYAGGTLLSLLLVLLIWGLVEPYYYDVEERTVVIPQLPSAWEGRRVAQISDWQIGMWLDNESTVQETVARIIEEDPAVVLLSGDFIYHPVGDAEDQIQKAVELARGLTEAGLPTYAVLGNHDYGMSHDGGDPNRQLADRVANGLDEAGIHVLRNESVPLRIEGGSQVAGNESGDPLFLVGIGPEWPERADVDRALAGVPEGTPRLVMMHNPNTYERIPAGAAPLATTGHTHGGQIRIPFLPDWSYLTVFRPGYVAADGWIDIYDVPGNRLYVNRGIGMSAVPLRINCMPEITLFTLSGS